jgi:hypothetical protein
VSFFRGSETVIIKRRSANGTDAHGNKTYSVTTIRVTDCMVGLGGTGEPGTADRDPIDQSLTIYMPNGTQVQPGDRFLIRGLEFAKDGNAQEWVPPFDFNVGVVVQVKRRNG